MIKNTKKCAVDNELKTYNELARHIAPNIIKNL